VAQPFLDGLEIDADGRQPRGMRVNEIVESIRAGEGSATAAAGVQM
jgi:hypothetical protein